MKHSRMSLGIHKISLEVMTQKFFRTTMGISIAEEIGIDKIRSKCTLFDNWLTIFEEIQSTAY